MKPFHFTKPVNLHAQWKALATDVRWRVVAVLVFVPIAAWMAWAANPDTTTWRPIVQSLSAEQVADCAEYLESRSIPFEIRGGGRDLWAPAGVSAELKIELTQFTEGRNLSAAVNGERAAH